MGSRQHAKQKRSGLPGESGQISQRRGGRERGQAGRQRPPGDVLRGLPPGCYPGQSSEASDSVPQRSPASHPIFSGSLKRNPSSHQPPKPKTWKSIWTPVPSSASHPGSDQVLMSFPHVSQTTLCLFSSHCLPALPPEVPELKERKKEGPFPKKKRWL